MNNILYNAHIHTMLMHIILLLNLKVKMVTKQAGTNRCAKCLLFLFSLL